MSVIGALIYSFNGKPQALPLNFAYAYDSRRRSIFEERQPSYLHYQRHGLVSGLALATGAIDQF